MKDRWGDCTTCGHPRWAAEPGAHASWCERVRWLNGSGRWNGTRWGWDANRTRRAVLEGR